MALERPPPARNAGACGPTQAELHVIYPDTAGRLLPSDALGAPPRHRLTSDAIIQATRVLPHVGRLGGGFSNEVPCAAHPLRSVPGMCLATTPNVAPTGGVLMPLS